MPKNQDILIEKIKKAKENNFKTPKQLARLWAERIKKGIDRPLSTGFRAFDEDLDHVLRGELCAVIGYGGTKKSLWSLNQSNINASRFQARTLYSSMEMSPTKLLDRVIDFAFMEANPTAEISAHKVMKENIKLGNIETVIEDLELLLDKYYGNNLIIDWQPSMTADDYEKKIDQIEDLYGPVDCLVVDGLGMMSDHEGETKSVNEHTKKLKHLANEKDIFIPIIVHCSKGGERTTRDVSKYARGSEKIKDNVDFYMMFSQIEDPNGDINKDVGWIQFVNKRGSGNTIDQIYEFNKNKLFLEDSDLDPSQFEIQTEDNKKY